MLPDETRVQDQQAVLSQCRAQDQRQGFFFFFLFRNYETFFQSTLMIFCSTVYQLGGRNTVLVDALRLRIPQVSDIPTIIFGADVTHPETGEDSSPSIAAVISRRLFLHFLRYNLSLTLMSIRSWLLKTGRR